MGSTPRKAQLILLTGLQGIGKTTVATSLAALGIERLHFGGLLRKVVQEHSGLPWTHEGFRRQFHRWVTRDVLVTATRLAAAEVAKSRSKVCVMDSHAVANTPFGLLATPDDSRRMRMLPFDGIVHLSASGSMRRIVSNSQKGGREPITAAQVGIAEQVQLSVVMLYASAHDCPLLVVSAAGTIRHTVQRVSAAIERLLG